MGLRAPEMNIQYKVDVRSFAELISRRAAAFNQSRDDAVKQQANLLAKELIARTQPLSGKTINKILSSQEKTFKDPGMIDMRAKEIGERAVIRDRRKKLKGKGLTGQQIQKDVEAHKVRVGMAKAGWVPSLKRSGELFPKVANWISRHGNTQGAAVVLTDNNRVVFELINRSSWGASKYVGRVVLESIAGRERAMEADIRRQIERTVAAK